LILFNLHFGLTFDDIVFPLPDTEGGHIFLGEKGLLQFLEAHLGLAGHPSRIEHIRTEQYRQALRRYLKSNPNIFYKNSFDADQLACAEALLQRRDELRLAGYDFALKKDMPSRLKVLADIEKNFSKDKPLIADYADRFEAILQAVADKNIPVASISMHEPMHLLPPQYLRLFEILKIKNIDIVSSQNVDNEIIIENNDLHIFKQFVENKLPRGEKHALQNDGSIAFVEATRDTEAADFMARVMALNGGYRPTFLISDKNRVLDDAFIHNGLPAFGLPSSSLGRPTLQLLKLVTTFLWRPLDPYKVLEFVTMPTKPLDYDLGTVIANVMSQRPGIHSEQWWIEITRFFEDLEQRALADVTIDVKKIKEQYEFWFDRPTFEIEKAAPKEDIIAIFNTLREWASAEFEAGNSKNTSLIVLSEQAKRVQEFLEELPEADKFLTYLELERIIRTIYEPAPIQPKPCELGFYHYFHKEGCLRGGIDRLVWWNFTDTEGVHFFSRWYKSELQYLDNQQIKLRSPQDENALMLWYRIQPILRTRQQIVFIFPKKVNGSDATEHALMSHLRACFSNFEDNIVHIKDGDTAAFETLLELDTPQYLQLDFHRLGKKQAQIEVYNAQLTQREHETLTSLEALFYYPHQWVFRHKAKLSKSAILSVVRENTLKGNIAHRFFELVLEQNFYYWTRQDADKWVDENSKKLFQREAATLLMYGFEPERVQLERQIKYAIWTLINFIRYNKWTVLGTEKELKGKFNGLDVKGRADIVLQRDNEYCVLDLKWSGHSYRERLIKNGEDLQLVMYSRLLTEEDDWAHTAYFIIENARLIARNTLAFKDIKALMPDVDAFEMNAAIWEKMLKTYNWRIAQIGNGKVEIRTEMTAKELEEIYGDELLDVLEMKSEDAKFDDYRTLIGLIT
jgi:ATP-dependent helicase/nuclease subunit B